MKGDYHRYLAEFAGGDGRKGASEAAHEAYKQATEIAQSDVRFGVFTVRTTLYVVPAV